MPDDVGQPARRLVRVWLDKPATALDPERGALRAEWFADRTDAKVATASTTQDLTAS